MSDQGFGQGGQGQDPAQQQPTENLMNEAQQAQPAVPAQPSAAGQGGQDMFSGAEQAIQGQVDQGINQGIEQLASNIPGGQQFAPEIQQAAGGLVNNLGQQAEHLIEEKLQQGLGGGLGGMLGGLFGGHQGNQGNEGNQGS